MCVLGSSIGIDLSINGAHDCTVLDATGQLAQRFSFDSSSAGLLKLEQRIRTLDPAHGAPTVVMEPTGLAWLLPCLYLRAQLPDVKIVRIKTSKVAALRRYLKQDAKSDRLDSLTLAKMPLVDPETLYAVDLPPATLRGLDRMTRQRARLVESLTARKNRLQAVVGGYLPGLMAATGKPWESTFRAVLTVSLNPVALSSQDEAVLRKALQGKPSRKEPPEAVIPRLRTACAQLTRLYGPIVKAGLVTEVFFDDLHDEVARELHLMDVEEQEVKALESAIARRYEEVAPQDHLGTMPGLGVVTAPTMLAAVGTPQRFQNQAAFRGWTGVVPHAAESADSEAKGLPMTKAGPKRVKLALYQAAETARQWDPQLAKIYFDQMVHKGKPHYKAVGAVMSHLASRIHAVLTEQRDYVLQDVDGREVSAAEARTIVKTQYQVPAEIRAARRTSNRRKRNVSTDAHRGSATRSSRRPSPSSRTHSIRSQEADQIHSAATSH
ncbi:MAG TPA: IS110 family transposase [Gemmatimonadales bacterium]|jgi:transposase|nr:IS110 family transposase [Gemmatimonadales bacterium]